MIARVISLVVALTPAVVQAHALWIEERCEPNGNPCEVSVYYGEYNEGVRETKATRLQERAEAEAFVLDGKSKRREIPLTMEDGRLIGTVDSRKPVVVLDDGGEVVDFRKYGIGIVRPYFYARYTPPAAVSIGQHLPLDIVAKTQGPWKAGNEMGLQVLFNGKGIKNGVKVQIYAPNGWSKEGNLDEDGMFSFVPLWRGLYVLEATFKEEVAGEYRGKSYEAKRHRATLSVEVEE